MKLTAAEFAVIFDDLEKVMKENREYLIKLDGVVGDGDLGITMTDGFGAVNNYVKTNPEETDLGKLFYNAGKTMNAHASSSLGTLISSGFMQAGKVFKGKTEMSGMEIAIFLDAFEQGIIKIGKSKVGEKTFLDGFDPAVQVMKQIEKEEDSKEMLLRAAEAAKKGSDSTVGMLAVWGRAARRGEDSRSLLDPGSVAAALIIKTIAECEAVK